MLINGVVASKPFGSVSDLVIPDPNILIDGVGNKLRFNTGFNIKYVDPSYRATVIGLGPFAYWEFDELSGATDSVDTISGYTIPLPPSYTLENPGLVTKGTGVLVNGSAQSSLVGAVSPGTVPAVSLETWIRVPIPNFYSRKVLVGLGSSPSDLEIYLFIKSGANSVWVGRESGGAEIDTGYSLSSSKVHHLVLTAVGTEWKFYANGQLIDDQLGLISKDWDNITHAFINYKPTPSALDRDDEVDDTAFYGSALSSPDVWNLWTRGNYPIASYDVSDWESVDFDYDLSFTESITWFPQDYNATAYVDGHPVITTPLERGPGALVSPIIMGNSRTTLNLHGNGGFNNNVIGVVFCYQNPRQYYLLSWRKSGVTTGLGTSPDGPCIQVIDLGPGETTSDLFLRGNGQSEVLMEESGQWGHSQNNEIQIIMFDGGFRVTVRRIDTILFEGDIYDTTYTSGRFGLYHAHQQYTKYYNIVHEYDYGYTP
jgi:hypothetical protein